MSVDCKACEAKQHVIEKTRVEADVFYLKLKEIKAALEEEISVLTRNKLFLPPLYQQIVTSINTALLQYEDEDIPLATSRTPTPSSPE